jgi:hypothetical protein
LGIVYQTDKRSNITYAYENQSFWDKELKRSRSKRTLIGRVDKETGEIIPTDGRCKRLSPYQGQADDYQMPKTMKEMRIELRRLLEENASLKEQLAKAGKEQSSK